jgi:indolepyruvate decarboxylase
VYIEIPRDMVAVPCACVPPLERPTPDAEALQACVSEILGRLASATAPVLMVGVEVRRFGLEAKVAELARRLGLPVVTSFMGRGLLASANAPLTGTYLGVAGAPEVTRSVESSDGLFLLGVIISDTNFGVSEKKIDMRKTIQALDGRVTMAYHTYPGIPLEAMVDAMLARTPATNRRFEVKAQDFPRHLPDDDTTLAPLDIATAINDLMATHGRLPIASDIGDCLFTAMDIENTELVAPGYYSTMGFGVPAGLGLQAASGERPLILVGDGAFQMTGWELGNCRRYGFDPIVILFNNRSWEMLRTFQPQSRFNNLDDWNFARMAPAMGGEGVRVTTRRELRQALADAYSKRGCFQLIEVMLPRGVLSPTLERFVAGIKQLSKPAG